MNSRKCLKVLLLLTHTHTLTRSLCVCVCAKHKRGKNQIKCADISAKRVFLSVCVSFRSACHSYPPRLVLPVACTFVEIQQCQLCNTKATMPSSFCLTEAKAALQAFASCLPFLLLLLLLFPVVLRRTKIARFSLSLFVMPLPLTPPLTHARSTLFVPLSTCFRLLFYVRNLHWPLCRRLLHFCFLCIASWSKVSRRAAEKQRKMGEIGRRLTEIMTLKCALY